MTAKTYKKIRIAAFIVCSLVFIAVPLSMAYQYHQIRQQGEAFTFEVEGYDPYTPMLGRFVRIRLQPSEYRISDKTLEDRLEKYSYRDNHPLYVEFTAGGDGLAKIGKVSAQIPATRSYWKIINYYYYESKLNIHYPLDRVYMNENRAPKLEKELTNRKVKVTATVRLRDGIGVLDKIEFKPAK